MFAYSVVKSPIDSSNITCVASQALGWSTSVLCNQEISSILLSGCFLDSMAKSLTNDVNWWVHLKIKENKGLSPLLKGFLKLPWLPLKGCHPKMHWGVVLIRMYTLIFAQLRTLVDNTRHFRFRKVKCNQEEDDRYCDSTFIKRPVLFYQNIFVHSLNTSLLLVNCPV